MTAPHVTATRPARPLTTPTDPGWEALSVALTAEAPAIAGRGDLTATIAPGAGTGALAWFDPDTATIAIEGTNLGIAPATARPWRPADRTRYAPTWGAFVHECAHARHTRWTTPPRPTEPETAGAAMLLEEGRAEAAHLRRRPGDRHWLRAAVRELVFADTGGLTNTEALAPTRYAAAHAAALMLARIDAGVLTAAETAPAAAAIEAVLGRDLLRQLRTLWRIAHRLSDTNAGGMLELGRRWFALVGPEPHTTPQPGSSFGTAISGSLGDIAKAVAEHRLPADPAAAADHAARSEARDADRAAITAASVFRTRIRPGTHGHRTRTPRTEERTAARALARALNTASQRERATSKTTSALPPGRVRMRGVMAREAQRAAGALPTAQPFTRTTRKPVPIPPLRLGIACDRSGSMRRFVADTASAAWILATAAHLASMPADTATLAFGSKVLPITHPGTVPAKVTEFPAPDDYEAIDTAIDALDGALGLSRPENTRLLVIISDGHFEDIPRRAAQKRLDRLRASGCAVLWLTPHPRSTPLTGATVHTLTDPAAIAAAIARAAVAAVRDA
ncbi:MULTISPECIES: hypothetical protein [unclassified Nocardia]|uniref:hypothetical protein n=1 Tax=unclassified Nocardia TaxID=2637762 RepID=UPI00278C8730|nr:MULTISPECIES: hypothetical protein [unclassified Nocardia]